MCKLWLSITSGPQFIYTNLDRSSKSRPPSVLSHVDGYHCGITVDDDPKRTPDRFLIVSRPTSRSSPPIPRSSPTPTKTTPHELCISDRNGYIELLNPTTGEPNSATTSHEGQCGTHMMALSSNGDTHEWALKYCVSCFIVAPLFVYNERILVGCSDCHRPKPIDKEEPPALVYHHLDCKDGCTTQVYREGKPESPLIYHYLKGQEGSNFEEFYRNTGIRYSQPFTHVESLVSLRNQ